MPAVIVTPPEEVYERFNTLKDNEIEEIACNDAYGVVIYISSDFGVPEIVVEMDDEPIYGESYIDADESKIEPGVWCEDTARRLYNTCLTSMVLDLLDGDYSSVRDDETSDYRNIDHEIDDREFELQDCAETFVYTATKDSVVHLSMKEEEEMVEDIKEKLLEYIARKYKIDIWRPMYLQDENGEEFLEEYPYTHLIFDEKDVDKIFDK